MPKKSSGGAGLFVAVLAVAGLVYGCGSPSSTADHSTSAAFASAPSLPSDSVVAAPPPTSVAAAPPVVTEPAPVTTVAPAPPPPVVAPAPNPAPAPAPNPAPAPAPNPAPAPAPQAPAVAGSAPILRPPSGGYYRAGEFCPKADAGLTTQDAQGRTLICTQNNGLRWEPA
jgi:outer membrane biosynthesis protein TonB